MDIKVSLLRTFIAVFEERSISAAAERLYIAQPAVSNRIHQLEKSLGTDLLVRSSTGVEPNSLGKEFYADAVEAIRQNEALVQKYTSSSNEPAGIVRIGLPIGLVTQKISVALGEFKKKHPLVRLLMLEEDSGRLRDLLIREEVDFVIAPSQLYSDQIRSTFLSRTEVVMISCAESEWQHLERVSASSLPPINLVIPPPHTPVRDRFDRYVSDHDIEIELLLEFDSFVGTIHLVRDSDWRAFGMMPKLAPFLSGNLLTLSPLDPPIYEDICIHQPMSTVASEAVKLCMGLIAKTLEEDATWDEITDT